MHRLLLCLALFAMTGLGQTSPVAKPASTTVKKTAPATKSSSGNSASNDAAIEKTIRAKLAASKISTDKFEVHVQGGVATLTGRTDVLQHKGTATRLAKSAGAKEVVNKVQVSDAAKDKAAA